MFSVFSEDTLRAKNTRRVIELSPWSTSDVLPMFFYDFVILGVCLYLKVGIGQKGEERLKDTQQITPSAGINQGWLQHPWKAGLCAGLPHCVTVKPHGQHDVLPLLKVYYYITCVPMGKLCYTTCALSLEPLDRMEK